MVAIWEHVQQAFEKLGLDDAGRRGRVVSEGEGACQASAPTSALALGCPTSVSQDFLVKDLDRGVVFACPEESPELVQPGQLLKRRGWWNSSSPVVLPRPMFHDDANQCSANSTPTTAAASPAPTPRTSAAVPRHGEVCHDALASLCSEPRVTLPFPKAELTFIRVSGTGTSRDPQGSAYTAYFLDVKCPGASAPLWRVHRRFKEFRALDEDLRRGGFMPPPLPPRRLIGLLDPLIVAQRREELEAWLYQLIDAATADVPHLQSFEPFRAFLLANADNPPSPMEVNKELWELHGGELGEGEGGDAAGEGQGGQGRGAEGRQRVGLADFEQMRVIGKGSFGKVTLVRKRSCGRLFAMKALAKSHLERSKQVEHTRTERHVLGRIKHPFIVGMHYAWTTRAKVYFVLDYCAGGELFFHLSQRKRMPEYMARFYAAEITLALEHLHGCDIAYRDLKPENIILDMEGHIKLADFGLAKTGVRHSAHEYLSPEILNRRGHGTAVDWWGLGMVIFEMLTGLPPWYTTDRRKLFQRLRSAPPRWLPPWYTTDRRKLFQRLRSGPLSFPAGVVSCTAADAIARLLRRDPLARLGGGARGASDVKDHPFFKSVDWRALLAREVRPPFAPCPRARSSSGGGGGGGADTRNFDAQFTRLPLDSVEDDFDDPEPPSQCDTAQPDSSAPPGRKTPRHTPADRLNSKANDLYLGFTYASSSACGGGGSSSGALQPGADWLNDI